jgi:signal transduction histidine kinase/CheY-like chemotaxis protein
VNQATDAAMLDSVLLDHAGEILLAVDAETLTITAANSAACTRLGYAREALIGRAITDLESALSDVFYWEDVRQGARGEVSDTDGVYRCGDDSLLPVVKDIRRTTVAGRDLLILRVRDERRRLRGEENLARMTSQLKAALEATGDGILVIDSEGWIVNLNHRFGEMWEIPDETLHEGDAAITAWLTGCLLDPDAYRRGMEDAAGDGRGESFDILALTDGRFFERRARPQILDEQIIGRVYSFHDITERVRSERDLIELRDRAEQASLAKGRFLAVMSHEIRTPMNGILGMAQLLQMPGLSEAERLDYARTVIESGQTLLALLNDILDLSKIEAGKIELTRAPFDPWQLIDEQAALFAGAARTKGLEITASWQGPAGSKGRHYWGDALRLRQILANLIGNATKFTARGFVRIEAGEIHGSDGRLLLEFSVADSGIGIPADKQAQLFEPFTQADASTTREYGGTGLGLSIVRTLVDLMEGEVGISSAAGQGARFWFRIPAAIMTPMEKPVPASAANAEAAAEATPGTPPHAGAFAAVKRHILVVEDNPTNRYVIENLLSRLGLSIRCATNGKEGLEAIAADPPALVLMDCQMPIMDGFAATKAIREWEAEQSRPRLPIIALTAGVFAEDRTRCAAVGMDDFLPKPVSFDALTHMLVRWLSPDTPVAAPAMTAPAKATTAVFDKLALLDMLDGDRDLAQLAIKTALHDMPEYFDRFEHAVATENWNEAGRILHSLKSLTAQIGGGMIVSSVNALDQELKGNGRVATTAAKALHAEYETLATELRAWINAD